MPHSKNTREGKAKSTFAGHHNRKAGHARQIRQMGTRSSRRRLKDLLRQTVQDWYYFGPSA